MMINLKKMTTFAFLASMMGTSSLLAMEDEDKGRNSSHIPVKSSAPSYDDIENTGSNSNGNAAPSAPQKETSEKLKKQMEELKLRIAQREKEEELERKEAELKNREQELKKREETLKELEQAKTKTQEEEKKPEPQASVQAQSVSQSKEKKIFGRTPERIGHNVATETERALKGVGNLIKHGKWHKKEKKKKK